MGESLSDGLARPSEGTAEFCCAVAESGHAMAIRFKAVVKQRIVWRSYGKEERSSEMLWQSWSKYGNGIAEKSAASMRKGGE